MEVGEIFSMLVELQVGHLGVLSIFCSFTV
nr:MAG TPA: hypothetical protein [Caudoviricetes sp.]